MASPPPSPEIVSKAADARAGTNERVERGALVLIVLVVGALAGRASFSHVVDWSMRNLPDGTPRLYGYTNAAVSELLPVGVLLFVRFQRRHGRQPGALAWSILVGAGLFSVTAQLAVAKASLSGWVVSAAPMVAFMLLTKLVLALLAPVAPANELLPAAAVPRAVPKPAVSRQPATKGKPATQPTADAAGGTSPMPTTGPRSALPPSLTGRSKVAAAVATLGPDAPIADIASKAGVSVSTARRHLPREQQRDSPEASRSVERSVADAALVAA